MTKLTIAFTPRHFNAPRAPASAADPMALPVGDADERGESGLMEFLGLPADFEDTVPAELTWVAPPSTDTGARTFLAARSSDR